MEFLRGLDVSIFTLINSTLSHPWLDWFFPAFTDMNHNRVFQIGIPLLVLGLLIKQWRKFGVVIFVSLIVTVAFADWSGNTFGKNYFERPRPFNTPGVSVIQRTSAGGYSFPSNHSVNSFAFATFLAPFLPVWSGFFYAVAVLIGYSRIYCGVHFPSDVLAGAIWGIFIGLLFSRAIRKILLKVSR